MTNLCKRKIYFYKIPLNTIYHIDSDNVAKKLQPPASCPGLGHSTRPIVRTSDFFMQDEWK